MYHIIIETAKTVLLYWVWENIPEFVVARAVSDSDLPEKC